MTATGFGSPGIRPGGARRLSALGAITCGAALALLCVGCDRELSPEDRLSAAAEQLEDARTRAEEAQKAVARRRDSVRDAQERLATAEKSLRKAERLAARAEAGLDKAATDVAIFRAVQDRLLDDIARGAVSATVHDRVVELRGSVPTPEAHARALAIARETAGVTDVQDMVVVRAGGGAATAGPEAGGHARTEPPPAAPES